jgi:preprotein translocase subunit SecF
MIIKGDVVIMVKVLKIIISVILIAVLIVFPVIASRHINFKTDKKNLLVIENQTDKKSNNSYALLLNIAEQNFKANEENADSAPKQSVVALWGIRDFQSILANENNEIINQNYDLSYKISKNDEVLNNNLIIKSEQISILLFYLMLSVLLIGVIAILLFIWKTELKLEKTFK